MIRTFVACVSLLLLVLDRPASAQESVDIGIIRDEDITVRVHRTAVGLGTAQPHAGEVSHPDQLARRVELVDERRVPFGARDLLMLE